MGLRFSTRKGLYIPKRFGSRHHVSNETNNKTRTTMTTTTINGYRVSLKPATDDSSSECWITRGKFSASLGYAINTGELHSDQSGVDAPIDFDTVERIHEWAIANGW